MCISSRLICILWLNILFFYYISVHYRRSTSLCVHHFVSSWTVVFFFWCFLPSVDHRTIRVSSRLSTGKFSAEILVRSVRSTTMLHLESWQEPSLKRVTRRRYSRWDSQSVDDRWSTHRHCIDSLLVDNFTCTMKAPDTIAPATCLDATNGYLLPCLRHHRTTPCNAMSAFELAMLTAMMQLEHHVNDSRTSIDGKRFSLYGENVNCGVDSGYNTMTCRQRGNVSTWWCVTETDPGIIWRLCENNLCSTIENHCQPEFSFTDCLLQYVKLQCGVVICDYFSVHILQSNPCMCTFSGARKNVHISGFCIYEGFAQIVVQYSFRQLNMI